MTEENRPLTAIRGVAALWVVAHHAQPGWAPHLNGFAGNAARLGWVAVDVFFVLSGFIMAEVYAGLGPAGASGYWRRRALRVYPLHLCVMVALGARALAVGLLGQAPQPHPWTDYPRVLLLLQPYLSTQVTWNPPTWSIGVELACYALFPFVMPLLRRLPAAILIPSAAALAFAEWQAVARWGDTVVGRGALLRGLAGFMLGAVLARLPLRLTPVRAGVFETVACIIVVAGIDRNDPAATALGGALLILALSSRRGARWHGCCRRAGASGWARCRSRSTCCTRRRSRRWTTICRWRKAGCAGRC